MLASSPYLLLAVVSEEGDTGLQVQPLPGKKDDAVPEEAPDRLYHNKQFLSHSVYHSVSTEEHQ